MSDITYDTYIQGSPVYTNLLAGTEVPTIDPAVGRAMYEGRGRPVMSAPTIAPVYDGPPAQTFDLSVLMRDPVAVGLRVEDERALIAAVRPAHADALQAIDDVPEPGVLVLLSLGLAALARKVRR